MQKPRSGVSGGCGEEEEEEEEEKGAAMHGHPWQGTSPTEWAQLWVRVQLAGVLGVALFNVCPMGSSPPRFLSPAGVIVPLLLSPCDLRFAGSFLGLDGGAGAGAGQDGAGAGVPHTPLRGPRPPALAAGRPALPALRRAAVCCHRSRRGGGQPADPPAAPKQGEQCTRAPRTPHPKSPLAGDTGGTWGCALSSVGGVLFSFLTEFHPVPAAGSHLVEPAVEAPPALCGWHTPGTPGW